MEGCPESLDLSFEGIHRFYRRCWGLLFFLFSQNRVDICVQIQSVGAMPHSAQCAHQHEGACSFLPFDPVPAEHLCPAVIDMEIPRQNASRFLVDDLGKVSREVTPKPSWPTESTRPAKTALSARLTTSASPALRLGEGRPIPRMRRFKDSSTVMPVSAMPSKAETETPSVAGVWISSCPNWMKLRKPRLLSAS